MAEKYPLSWPAHWKRTRTELRMPAQFRSKGNYREGTSGARYSVLTISEGIARLKLQLGLLRASDIVISSNVALTSYGEPRSGGAGGDRAMTDPGVAVYFELGNHDRVLACDRW